MVRFFWGRHSLLLALPLATPAQQQYLVLFFPISFFKLSPWPEKWFAQDERSLATSVGALAPIVGAVAASIVSPMFTADLTSLLLLIALGNTTAFCLLVLVVRDEPPTPPSLSAAEEKSEWGDQKLTFTETVVIPLKNHHFVLLMVIFMFGYAPGTTLLVVINQVLSPLGYSDSEIGRIGSGIYE